MAAKAAWPRDSWPATPTRRVSPTAPMAVAITNRPSWSQKSSRTSGSARAMTSRPRTPSRRGRSDTDCLLTAEQTLGPHEQDDDHDDVGHDLAEAGAQEGEVALVAHGQRGDQADDQAADHGAGHGVEPTENPGGDGEEGRQRHGRRDSRGRERGEEDPGHRGEHAGEGPAGGAGAGEPDAHEGGGRPVGRRGPHADPEAGAGGKGTENRENTQRP